MEPKPTIVFHCGMPRGGTTSFYHNIQKHPQVAVPYRKETHFFSFNFHKGLEWYLDLFAGIKPGQVGFDVSPSYFLSRESLGRIKAYDPEAKAILCVRQPADFALSLYRQFKTYDYKIATFGQFLDGYLFRVGDGSLPVELSKGLIRRMLNLYMEMFGANLLIYSMEMFARDQVMVLRQVERFVGLSPFFKEGNFSTQAINSSNRFNIRFVSAIIGNERFIQSTRAVFPERALRRCRMVWDRLVAPSAPGARANSGFGEELALAAEVLAEDTRFVRDLFSEGGIIDGRRRVLDAEH